jgi:tRNA 5-methylaminomethyl-2-thiouridine biosynthesis bifunctional protein
VLRAISPASCGPLPSVDDNRLARLTRAGFLEACRALRVADGRRLAAALGTDRRPASGARRHDTPRPSSGWSTSSSRPPTDLRFVDRGEASQLAGWPVANGGWWFPGGGWVDPASLCRANLARHAVGDQGTHYGCWVADIERQAGLWRACDSGGQPSSPKRRC